MTTRVMDIKGNEIKPGSLIKAKNSNIVREVQRWVCGTEEAYVDHLGEIQGRRIDGKQVGRSKWLNPSQVEVVG